MSTTDDIDRSDVAPVPPPTQRESHLPPPPPAPRRRRRWPWIAGAAVLIAVIGAVGLVVFDQTALTNDLVHARFTDDARPFSTGASADYRFALVDGGYQVTATTGEGVPVESFGRFARRAYQVEVSLTVVDGRAAGTNGVVGIGCWNKGAPSGYTFAQTEAGYALVRADSERADVLATVERAVTWGTTPVRLTITCGATSPGGRKVALRGLVDGVEVVTATDADGITAYDAAVVEFHSDTPGASVLVDDVDAIVPGS